MAITVGKTSPVSGLDTRYAEAEGQTDTNEVIIKLDPNLATLVEAVVTSAGSATLKTSLNGDTPTSYTGFTADSGGAVSANTTWQLPPGVAYVGIDLASGTWSLFVRQYPLRG